MTKTKSMTKYPQRLLCFDNQKRHIFLKNLKIKWRFYSYLDRFLYSKPFICLRLTFLSSLPTLSMRTSHLSSRPRRGNNKKNWFLRTIYGAIRIPKKGWLSQANHRVLDIILKFRIWSLRWYSSNVGENWNDDKQDILSKPTPNWLVSLW